MDTLWQTASFGGIVAALVAALTAGFQRRRDDRLESRRTRKDAGVQAILTGLRLRSASVELIALDSELFGVYEESGSATQAQRDDRRSRVENWHEARLAAAEQIPIARALAARPVSAVLVMLAHENERWMSSYLQQKISEFDPRAARLHQEALDRIVERLSLEVRDDALTDLGAKQSRRSRRRFRRQLDGFR